MWHKKKGGNNGSGVGTGIGDECTLGQTFYVSPPGFSNISEPQYIESTPNPDMNFPGIRYFHLWDDNVATITGATSIPNRVGKVFPDLQMIIIDDQELVAALSYKSNRNWTLPMPKVELVPAGTSCDTSTSSIGFFNGLPNMEQVWLTYMLETTSGQTSGLHCNYYNKLIGDTSAGPRDMVLNFGPEFPYIRPYNNSLCSSYSGSGVQVDKLNIIFQKTTYGVPPNPTNWQILDITSQLPNFTANTAIEATNLITNCPLYLTYDTILSASTYNLHDYINIPLNNNQEPTNLQFGDEYFFYGSLDTDIMATIYEMVYAVTLFKGQWNTSLNPTWNPTDTVRITEIGLYDNDEDLMVIAKLQYPIKRVSTAQSWNIKIDF